MRPRFLIHILLIAVFGLIAAGCAHTPDDRLLRAESMMSDSLPQARAILDSIDRTSLSEADRNLHDLLTIKAADKAYVKHTADSTILRVVDYYGRHQSTGHYPEALYYAGRVYSDLGDYPTALEYYHRALDELSDEDSDMDLQGRVVSNLAYILNALRMYEQAIPYAEETLKIVAFSKDTTDIMFSHQQMGIILMHAGKFDGAEYHLNKSLLLAQRNATDNLAACQQMYLAAVKYNKNHIDSALNLIRGVPERITDSYHHTALAYAMDIYLNAGLLDTAYLYAEELTLPENRKNWRMAYEKLLFTSLRDYIPLDSIGLYYRRYGEIVEEFARNNGNEAAVLENTVFNYDRHDRDRKKAELKSVRLSNIILCLLLVIFASVSVLMFIQAKRRKQLVEFHEAVEHIMLLRQNLELSKKETDKFKNESLELQEKANEYKGIADVYKEKADEYKDEASKYKEKVETLQLVLGDTKVESFTDKERLIARLRDEIKGLAECSGTLPGLPEALIESDIYGRLLQQIKERKTIPEKSALWKEISNLVDLYYPHFRTSLMLLLNGHIRENTYHMLLLIKLRVSPSVMADLIGREIGTMSSNRGYLCKSIFGSNEGAKYFDRAIILM